MVIVRNVMTDARKASPPPAKTQTPPGVANRTPGTPPAAGPHAQPRLTDPEKTPGAGSLPDPDRPRDGNATTG